MYRQAVRKPAGVQSRKKEQVTQKASESASNSLSLQKIASRAGYAKSDRQSSGTAAKAPVNLTGLPGNLKAGVEALSGCSLDSVRVHYNSPEPKKLNARAYTRGTDIYVGAGQERSLPHEAWHVVQQLQDRVRPTRKINSFNVNDSVQLEREADIMGARALSASRGGSAAPAAAIKTSGTVQCCKWISSSLSYERRLGREGNPEERIRSCKPRSQEEWNELMSHSTKLAELRGEGLTYTIHHMLSRSKLGEFSRSLTEAQQNSIRIMFRHTHGNVTDTDDVNRILCSLRSNLVFGPTPESRVDDPAHQHGPKPDDDFDPTHGDYAPVSDIYARINDKLNHPDQTQTVEERNKEIIDLLRAAEGLYARIQVEKGLRPDMLNTDVQGLWEKVPQADGTFRWRKKTP